MNVLVAGKHFPISMMVWFKRALRKMGHRVFSIGPYCPTIPWNVSRDYSAYLDIPDVETDDVPSESAFYAVNMARIKGFEPDLILSVHAGFYLTDANMTGIHNAILLTDPHALKREYLEAVEHYETVISMQHHYKFDYAKTRTGAERPVFWVPYAYDSDCHYWTGTDFTNRPFDVCIMSALLYPERLEALAWMENAGIKIYQDSGLLFDSYTRAYQDAVIGFNRSGYGKVDLPARFWEALAMRNLCITNRVPDLLEFPDLKEDIHYVAYSDLDEMIEKVKYYSTHRDVAWRIASAGYGQVWMSNHSYVQRSSLILDVSGVGNL